MRDHLREKVTIGYPFGKIEPRFHGSMLSLLAYDCAFGKRLAGKRPGDLSKSVIAVKSTHVAMGRNKIANRFLDECVADWLCFIDTDQTFPPDILERLIESADPTERPIVSALIMAKRDDGRIMPACVEWAGEETRVPKTIPATRWWVAIPGTGCTIVHRSVLVAMREQFGDKTAFPFFAYPDIQQPDGTWDTWGEDYTFMLRAIGLGFIPCVDTTIEVGHVKDHEITSVDFWRENPDAAARRWTEQPAATVTVIPFKDKWSMTRDLCEQIVNDGDGLLLMNNGSSLDETKRAHDWARKHERAEVIDCKGLGIHEMWNTAVDLCLQRFPKFNLAVFNNDLEAGPDLLPELAGALRSGPENLTAVCPNYDGRDPMAPLDEEVPAERLQGIYAGGNGNGLAGFCFMVKGELFQPGYRFPEECMWWYGDNDLTMTIDSLGGWYGMVHTATVKHLDGGSKTIGDADDYGSSPQGIADRDAFCAKWGLVVQEAS